MVAGRGRESPGLLRYLPISQLIEARTETSGVQVMPAPVQARVGNDPDEVLARFKPKGGTWETIARVSNELRSRGYSWTEIHEALISEGYKIPDFNYFRTYTIRRITALGIRD